MYLESEGWWDDKRVIIPDLCSINTSGKKIDISVPGSSSNNLIKPFVFCISRSIPIVPWPGLKSVRMVSSPDWLWISIARFVARVELPIPPFAEIIPIKFPLSATTAAVAEERCGARFRTELTWANNSLGRAGLVMYASAPASRPSTLSSTWLRAVNMMIGVFSVAGLVRMDRAIS